MSLLLFVLLVLVNEIPILAKIHNSFLPKAYKVQGKNEKFDVRQVPGDGGCLFHAIAVILRYEDCDNHTDFDSSMWTQSHSLRKLSVDTLMQKDEILVMEADENTTTTGLLETVALHYNTTPEMYCEKMRLNHTWGGGPEIVALSNRLRRPIHVYELDTGGIFKKCFQFKVCAKFGTPYFDSKPAINILCADGRFPNLLPGCQKAIGDHFLALFPSCLQDNHQIHTSHHMTASSSSSSSVAGKTSITTATTTSTATEAMTSSSSFKRRFIPFSLHKGNNNNNNNNVERNQYSKDDKQKYRYKEKEKKKKLQLNLRSAKT